jgi:insertion element IS1 protein InsB
LSATLVTSEAGPAAESESDELWPFVGRKSRKRWIWVTLSRRTRARRRLRHQRPLGGDVPPAVGRIPAGCRAAHCYSDFREAYRKVIPAERHTPLGKESGLTAHVERWNLTLRQRSARFVRKTLSFSKSDRMHEICLRLFIHRYNLSLRPT